MWINVDGVSVYTEQFKEGQFRLTRMRRLGSFGRNGEIDWTLTTDSGWKAIMEWGTLEQAVLSPELANFMPKTHAMLKEQVDKDERN